jgi:CelD/BcsL family acetyltransferase involved in cellulose biosynthesis
MTTDWDVLADGIAVAPRTGPFPHGPFLRAVEEASGTPNEDLIVVDSGTIACILVEDAGTIRFAGPEALTDYHSPLGADVEGLAGAFRDMSGARLRLDSMPHEACDVVVQALDAVGAEFSVSEHEATAVLDLPDTVDAWLASIGKKERHEVRRKRRRFVEEFGEVAIVEAGPEAMEAFCAMHRASEGPKGSFMTATMEAFFLSLVTTAGASIHNLVCDGRTRASAFGFETPDGYYYYNSAYDPDAAMASPGVVLLASLIERQISRGAAVFDFLKGDEAYKYRHGARRRPLFVVEGVVP